jgi:hypothetical protein
MEDISPEQFEHFAKSFVHAQVIDDNETLLQFKQDDKEVVIETSRIKCIFRKHWELYKLLYQTQNGKLYLMTGDITEDIIEEVNHGCQSNTLVCFREKIDDILHFIHIDKDFDVITNVYVKVKLI